MSAYLTIERSRRVRGAHTLAAPAVLTRPRPVRRPPWRRFWPLAITYAVVGSLLILALSGL